MAPFLGFGEPNLHIAQNVDLDAMRKKNNVEPEVKAEIEIARPRLLFHKPQYSQEPYDATILPRFESISEDVKANLSLERNEYLRLRFNSYLDNPPECLFKVQLYRERLIKRIQPRPFTLNGSFYDLRNRLAPIPYIPDPRQYDIKSVSKVKPKPIG